MPFPQGHALLIGVGSYQFAPHMNVPVTVADAKAVERVLRDEQLCGYPSEQVTLLCDGQASRVGILAALDALASRTTVRDTVLFFYAGHGDFGEDGNYYLTTHDTKVVQGKVQKGTGISQQELITKLRNIKAQRALLIFNACHSGAVMPTLGTDAAPPQGQNPPETLANALLSAGSGRILISACRAQQKSYYSHERSETVFTEALVQALNGQGVPNRNGTISAFDLYTVLYERVKSDVQRLFGAKQEPELTVLKGVGPFAVALYRGATALGVDDAPIAPPPQARTVEREESERALQQIMNVSQGVGIQGDVTNSTVIGGDQWNLQGSTGAVINPSGPVNQQFGNTMINTGGGDYAGGNIDKRQAQVFVDGSVIGSLGDLSKLVQGLTGQPTLSQCRDQIQRIAEQARANGDDDQADDLESVLAPLNAAIKAEESGRMERRNEKVAEARAALERLQPRYAALREIRLG